MGRYMGSYYRTLGSICDAQREDKLGGRVDDYDIYNVEATCSSSRCAGYGRGLYKGTKNPNLRCLVTQPWIEVNSIKKRWTLHMYGKIDRYYAYNLIFLNKRSRV
jgi:hypothetical protein